MLYVTEAGHEISLCNVVESKLWNLEKQLSLLLNLENFKTTNGMHEVYKIRCTKHATKYFVWSLIT